MRFYPNRSHVILRYILVLSSSVAHGRVLCLFVYAENKMSMKQDVIQREIMVLYIPYTGDYAILEQGGVGCCAT